MKLQTKSCLFGMVAAGCLFAVGVAQAEVRLVSVSPKGNHGIPVQLYKYANPNVTKAFVSDSASGALGVETFVDGWAFIDQVKCKQIGIPGTFAFPPDSRGTWTTGPLVSTLGSGACPGVDFTFSGISFTWTGKKAAAGAMTTGKGSELTTKIPAKYGLGHRAEIVDTVTFTYTGP
jgi:hypothetical protein